MIRFPLAIALTFCASAAMAQAIGAGAGVNAGGAVRGTADAVNATGAAVQSTLPAASVQGDARVATPPAEAGTDTGVRTSDGKSRPAARATSVNGAGAEVPPAKVETEGTVRTR